MNKFSKLALGAVVFGVLAFAAPSTSHAMCAPGHGDGSMTSMTKMESAHEAHATYAHHYSEATFKKAQMKGEKILLTFHLDGCSMCAKQELALNKLDELGELKNFKVLAVDYAKDTEALKKFKVGMQGSLVYYHGENFIAKKDMLTKISDIRALLQMK